MQYVTVRSVAERLKSRFKIDMDIFDIKAACADAMRVCRVMPLERKVWVAKVDNFQIHLPNVWKVRGVIRLDMIPNSFHIEMQDIWFPPQVFFTTTETDVTTLEPIVLKSNYVPQIKGPWMDHKWECPYVRFNETDVTVGIETTALVTQKDEATGQEMPLIPEPAFYLCLFYALYVYYEPFYILGQIDERRFERITQWKDSKVRQGYAALGFNALTSNQLDEVFNVMTSFDRKQYGTPL